jgi:hypothetical protein
MFRQTFYPSEDARLQSTNADYATACAGGTLAVNPTSSTCTIGQRLSAGTYYVWAGCLRFGTSVIPDEAIIESAVLFLQAGATYSGDDIVLRAYAANFGAAIGTEDWVDPRNLAAADVLADFATAGGAWTTATLNQFASKAAMLAAVNVGGFTDLVIVSDREVAGSAPPASSEYTTFKTSEISGIANDPSLVVTWSLPAEEGVTDYNYVVNPRFAVNVADGWTKTGAPLTVSRDAAPGVDLPAPADACCKFVQSSSLATYMESDVFPVSSGQDVAARLDLYWPGTTGYPFLVRIRAWGKDGPGSTPEDTLAETVTHSVHKDGFVTYTISYTVPAGMYYLQVSLGATTATGAWSDVNGNCPRVTNVRIDFSEAEFSEYYDGDSSGWDWLGTAHDSLSYALAVVWDSSSVIINAGAASTDDNDVTLAVSSSVSLAGGAAQAPDEMCFSDGGVTWSDWEEYATSRAYQLPSQADEEPHTLSVYGKFRVTYEGEWYESEAVSDSIDLQLDWTASVTFDEANPVDNAVAYNLAAVSSAGAVIEQRLSWDEGANWSEWAAFAPGWQDYDLPPQDDADPHLFTLSAQFRDNDGNTSPVVEGSTTLTITWATWLRINGGAEATASLEVELGLRATSSAGNPPTDYRLREQGGAWSAWQTFHGGRKRGWMYVAYELGGYGSRQLEVEYRDHDLNTSPALSASIFVLDTSTAAGVSGQDPAQVVIAGILVYYDGVLMAELEAVDGSVSADARRTVWRTADVSFSPSDGWTHREIYDLLVTPGIELVIRRGWVTAGGGEVLVSLGRFTVDEATFTENESGTEVTCACSDLSVRISRARWTDPYQITAGTTLVAGLVELLSDRWPDVRMALDANVIDNTIDAPVVFEAGDSSDPWSDAQKLAEAHGFTLYLDVEGVVRLMQPPDAASVVPAYLYRRDELAVVTAQTRVSPMEQTYNGVIATGEGSTLATPVRGEAWDLDPQSPTFVDGPFGRVPYFYSSPLIKTAETAEEVAGSMLERVRGRVESLSWEQIPNPAIVPLEAVELEDDTGALHTYIIDELSIPLSAADVQTATARETRITY